VNVSAPMKYKAYATKYSMMLGGIELTEDRHFFRRGLVLVITMNMTDWWMWLRSSSSRLVLCGLKTARLLLSNSIPPRSKCAPQVSQMFADAEVTEPCP